MNIHIIVLIVAGQTNEIEDDEFSSGVGDTQDREKRVIIYTLLN